MKLTGSGLICGCHGDHDYQFIFLVETAATKKDKLAEIMEKQASTITVSKTFHTKVDSNLKQQLVAQYAHQSDEEL